MAGEFLRSHGIDIDAEMARIQNQTDINDIAPQGSSGISVKSVSGFKDVSLPCTTPNTRWDISIADGKVSSIAKHEPQSEGSSVESMIDGHGAILAPGLCHPHIHIDKAYLLSHPKYAHLQIEKGDFAEAMSLTGSAKKDFEHEDLLERGQRLIDESIAAGVTHMRAFVEVDGIVGMKCLEAGIELKKRAEGRCVVQLCAFAQLPLFSGEDDGDEIQRLMKQAAGRSEVDVVGSTPYVEADRLKMEKNIEFMVKLSYEEGTHLDFHLDYNLDPDEQPMVWHILKVVKENKWGIRMSNRTIVLGHCTRLTLFKKREWHRLAEEIGDLPISFVGLPTSDLFMMRTEDRTRGTLDVPRLIKEHGINACVGINNIGNAFTPHGSCDPVTLACNGVGIYQSGTKEDAELLLECVSSRARRAIGLGERNSLEVNDGDDADLVLFAAGDGDWTTRRSASEVVYLYDQGKDRIGCLKGRYTTDGT